MEQASIGAQMRYEEIVADIPTRVHIPGTKREVKLRGIKPYTLTRLTRLWLERDSAIPKDAPDTLKSMCKEPYFSIKEACIICLNSWWKLILLYPFKWRIWAYLRGYTEAQVLPIIQEGKKKLPLTSHWANMVFSTDMRESWKRMTTVEAEQYRAELLSVGKLLSLKSSPATEDTVGE